VPQKFRNKFEEKASYVLGNYCKYEPGRYPYVVHRNYIPDFVGQRKGVTLLIECKGFFRVGDTKKYTSIRDSLEEDHELVFVLHNPNKRIRKGAKMNMAEWCEKEGIRWFTLDNIKDAFKR
tara:strand:+ start:841 stop:1203 length:363 start_codon:yes stop_codon:yes gene_type:complete